MVTQEMLTERVKEIVRQKRIYRKALDQIDMYGDLCDMQATARKAINDAAEPKGAADTEEPCDCPTSGFTERHKPGCQNYKCGGD